MCHNGELSYDIVDGVLYYSSSHAHLDSCTGGDCKTMKEGQVIRIGSDGTIDNSLDKDSPVATFVNAGSKASYYGRYAGYGAGYDWDNSEFSRSGSTTYTGAGRKVSKDWRSRNDVSGHLSDGGTGTENAVKDYDAEWQDAWADYCTESAHNADADSERYAG
jgi:hypothetical protein